MLRDPYRCQVCLVYVQPEDAERLLVSGREDGGVFSYCRDEAACDARVDVSASLDRAIAAARSLRAAA